MTRRWIGVVTVGVLVVAVLAFALLQRSAKPSGREPSPAQTALTRPTPDAAARTPRRATRVARTLTPTEAPQRIETDGITITIPGGLLTQPTELRITSVDDPPPPPSPAEQSLGAFDVSLGDLHELAHPIEIEIPVDASRLRTDCPPAMSLSAGWYDRALSEWVELPVEVRPTTGTLVIRTRHLSFFDWWYVGTWSYFILPGGNHGIFYDPEAVAAAEASVGYVAQSRQARPNVPGYVADLSAFADVALKTYASLGLVPHASPVKILVVPDGDPLYHPGWRRVHVPMRIDRPQFLQYAVAHELFHAIQHVRYGIPQSANYYLQALDAAHKWWLEATAEYAACRIAIEQYGYMGKMNEFLVSPRHLTIPLNTFGQKRDDNDVRYHQYQVAWFLDHVCRKLSPAGPTALFVKMYESVSASPGDAEEGLAAFLEAQGEREGIGRLYREFAERYLFSSDSPMGRRGISGDGVHPDATEGERTLSGAAAEPLLLRFSLAGHHTTKVFAVRPVPTTGEREMRVRAEIGACPAVPGMTVRLCVTPAGRRSPMKVVATFTAPADERKQVDLTLKGDQVLYAVAGNDAPIGQGLTLLLTPNPAPGYRFGDIGLEAHGPVNVSWGDGRKETVGDEATNLAARRQVVAWDPTTRSARLAASLDDVDADGKRFGVTAWTLVGTIAPDDSTATVDLTVTRTLSQTWSSRGNDQERFTLTGTWTFSAAGLVLKQTSKVSRPTDALGQQLTFLGTIPSTAFTLTSSITRAATNRGEPVPAWSYTRTGSAGTGCTITLWLSEGRSGYGDR